MGAAGALRLISSSFFCSVLILVVVLQMVPTESSLHSSQGDMT